MGQVVLFLFFVLEGTMKKKKIPKYDIVETLKEIINPEIEEITNAKNTLLSIPIKKEVKRDGNG